MDLDEKVKVLFERVQKAKEEIKSLEKPNWETNASFSYEPGSNTRVNIHTIMDVDVLINICGFLIAKKELHEKSCALLEIDSKEFKWMGFTLEQWTSDLKTRINKIQISTKKEKLQKMEAKLATLVSPEMKRKMDLEAIENELDDD